MKAQGFPPEPFRDLGVRAVEEARAWHGGFPQAKIDWWRYVRSRLPHERLLHLIFSGTHFCFHLQREHKSHRTMISVDLLRGHAWQRCWDPECVVNGLKAKKKLQFAVPVFALEHLDLFEQSTLGWNRIHSDSP